MSHDRRKLVWVLGCRGTGASFEIVLVVPSLETRAVVAQFVSDR